MYSQLGSSRQMVMLAKAYQAEQREIAARSRLAAQSRARGSRGRGRWPGFFATLTPRVRRPRSMVPKAS